MIVRLIAVKVEFIINEIINTIVIVQLKNSAILLSPGNINIYISDIAHFVFEFLGYALIQGLTTRASTSFSRSAWGSEPKTSPKPPVFINGAHSDVANNTFIMIPFFFSTT